MSADWEPDKTNHGRSGWLTIPAIPAIGASVAVDDPRSETALVGHLTRLINRLHDIPRHLAALEQQVLPDLANQLERTTLKAGGVFTRGNEMQDVRTEVAALRTTLEERYSDPEPDPTAAGRTSCVIVDDVDVALANLTSASATLRSVRRAPEEYDFEAQVGPEIPELGVEG